MLETLQFCPQDFLGPFCVQPLLGGWGVGEAGDPALAPCWVAIHVPATNPSLRDDPMVLGATSSQSRRPGRAAPIQPREGPAPSPSKPGTAPPTCPPPNLPLHGKAWVAHGKEPKLWRHIDLSIIHSYVGSFIRPLISLSLGVLVCQMRIISVAPAPAGMRCELSPGAKKPQSSSFALSKIGWSHWETK